MKSQPRTEPRGISLTDLIVLVAGCAVGCTLQPLSPKSVPSGDVYGTGFYGEYSLFGTIIRRPLLVIAFAIAATILVRLARHGRMPRPAEWPTLVLAAALVSTRVLDATYGLEVGGPPDKRSFWSPSEWPWAAAWALAALATLIVLAALRRRMPPWMRALVLASVAVMWLCGPAYVSWQSVPGEPPQPVGATAAWAFQLRWSEWANRGKWPELILFGVPITAGLIDRARSGRRAWTWTEWIGLVLGLVFAACWWLDRFAPSDPTNAARLAEVVVRGLWLGGIGLVSWLILWGSDAVRGRMTPAAHSGQPGA
jgi:hypothetical protein